MSIIASMFRLVGTRSISKDKERIYQMIGRMKRCGFLPESAPSAETIARDADKRLFRAIDGDGVNVLHKLLPEKRSHMYT